MGKASRAPDPDPYEHAHAYCELLVVGSGPAGRAAALSAAQAGLDVVLVEQDAVLGGDSLSQPQARADLAQEIKTLSTAGVRLMPRTTAFGLYDGGVAGLLERVTDHVATPAPWMPRQRFWTLRAQYTVVAAGALERHVAFGNNDRPGVMTANSARIYLNRFGIRGGEDILIATNNDSAYSCAQNLAQAGAHIKLIDARDTVPRQLRAQAEQSGIALHTGMAPLNALGTRA